MSHRRSLGSIYAPIIIFFLIWITAELSHLLDIGILYMLCNSFA